MVLAVWWRTPANPPGEGLITDVPLTIDPFIPTIVIYVTDRREDPRSQDSSTPNSGTFRVRRAPASA